MMHFELATVMHCNPNGCWVFPVGGGPAFETRYSALVINRVRILPGQLVAVDMEHVVPQAAWRWYRVRIVESGEHQVTVQERERQLSVIRVRGLEISGGVGDEVWVTGMAGEWELHDRVVNGKPSNPARMREKVIPRIARLLSGSEQT